MLVRKTDEEKSCLQTRQFLSEILSGSSRLALISASAAIVPAFSVYCPSHGITGSHRVKLVSDIEWIMLDINTAIPVGLILNELVNNALRHAFPGNRSGIVTITGRQEGDSRVLTVRDDGTGLPASLDWRNSTSLGLRLVISLVDQLDGTIGLLPAREGTGFRIVLRPTGQSGAVWQ